MTETYTERALYLADYLEQIGSAYFPDRFAALRHALYLTGRLLPEDHATQLARSPGLDMLARLAVNEFAWGRALQQGQEATPAFLATLTHKERAALLRGVVRAHAQPGAEMLLAQLGYSHTLDALVRDALGIQAETGLPEDFRDQLRQRFWEMERRHQSRALVVVLDIAAAHRVAALTDEEVASLLHTWNDHEPVILALLRYTGALKRRPLAPALHTMLMESTERSLARRLTLIDALSRTGELASCSGLRAFAHQLEREKSSVPTRVLQQYVAAIIHTLETVVTSPVTREGLTVAQFMFLGRIGRPGKGDSGGLGVFLSSLGDALGETAGIAHVYTLVLLNAAQAEDDPPLLVDRTPHHTIVHIPVCCRHAITQYQMMVKEVAIETALMHILDTFHLSPDIFHIRYSDHGSRAAARVAKRLGKRLALTVTTDPHRRLTSAFSKPHVRGSEARTLTFQLQQVYIADQLAALADGLIAMPTSKGTQALEAYFPQLRLDPQLQGKPLRMIAEGIQVGQVWHGEKEIDDAPALLCDTDSCRQGRPLDTGFKERPLILTVGRLHPVKQQPLLVQAWAESELWRDYNLVLIGGNLEHPNSIERRMWEQIEATFARYPEARGRFCLLPAMPNAELRQLEFSIIRSLPADLPHVYACSSVKEEFGIAVLEAMDAGFLVFGPEVGGLSSYIETGRNGFLIDTGTAETLAQGLCTVLRDADRYPSETLRAIANAGTHTVRTRYDIRTTAAHFAAFYREIAGG